MVVLEVDDAKVGQHREAVREASQLIADEDQLAQLHQPCEGSPRREGYKACTRYATKT